MQGLAVQHRRLVSVLSCNPPHVSRLPLISVSPSSGLMDSNGSKAEHGKGAGGNSSGNPFPRVQVLSTRINNLTIEVDQPTVYPHVDDVLITADSVPISNNNAGEDALSNGIAPLPSDSSGTNLSSDGSTQSDPLDTALRYDKDENGRIPAYIDFTEMEKALAPLRDAPNPLLG